MSGTEKKMPRYVIVNDTDCPQPSLVCQWVPGVGYCYLDRSKKAHDGMCGEQATSIQSFGWAVTEDEDDDLWVRFYRLDRPSTAKYQDGKSRHWQHRDQYFDFKRLVE